jgi:hypothetical protein
MEANKMIMFFLGCLFGALIIGIVLMLIIDHEITEKYYRDRDQIIREWDEEDRRRVK